MNKPVWFVIELIAVLFLISFSLMIIRETNKTLEPDPSALTTAPMEPANALLLSREASSKGPLEIAITLPIDLKVKTKAEMISLRSEQLNDLVKGRYTPISALFGKVDEQKPWWGIEGQYNYGNDWPGERNIEGPSEESRFLLNPLLLVGLTDLQCMTQTKQDNKWSYRIERDGEIPPGNYGPSRLTWWPEEKRAEARYDAGSWAREYLENADAGSATERRQIYFNITLYNAQDFGYQWAHLPVQTCQNISQRTHASQPFQLREFIHVGGSCGYPGGCNNASPLMEEVSWLMISRLPAILRVNLWKVRPRSVNSEPDMIFDILVE